MKKPLWFDLKVFYVRVSNYEVKASTPGHLTVNLYTLSPGTVLEVNGRCCNSCSGSLSSTLRRDRADKRTEEATFVSTDKIKMSGSLSFDICYDSDVLFSGDLEITEESRDSFKKWRIGRLEILKAGERFLKGNRDMGLETGVPAIDVYVAGCFSGLPVISMKTLELNLMPNHGQSSVLDSSSWVDHPTKSWIDGSSDAFQWTTSYRDPMAEPESPANVDSLYFKGKHFQDDDMELSWFNAGVRVGVGIGLGVSLGVGIGVGLLVRGYSMAFGRLRR
ncbi:uncharacterized protein At1g01500-like [Wolffia australiana]